MSPHRPMRLLRSTLLLAAIVAATSAHARDVVLHLPAAAALATPATHVIVGNLPLRFGSASATTADALPDDVQVEGEAGATSTDPTVRYFKRPTDEEVCQRALDDALTRLSAAARKAGAVAVVGIVSDYKGVVYDDPAAYECHSGTFNSYVWLRARFSRSKPHTLAVPPKSGYAELGDLGALPTELPAGKERYAHFLTLPKPRAFVFQDDGSWRFWADDPDAMTKALDDCARRGHKCWLYAVDDNVVWNADEDRRIGTVAQLRGDAHAPAVPVKDEHQ